MISVGAPDETRERAALAVWFGGASMACWLCCPFWILVCFIALPLAFVGLVRACVEYQASRGSDLPLALRARRSGRSTSTTVTWWVRRTQVSCGP
jgi:hypothetical protein